MNLTAKDAALAWASGKRVEAKAVTHDGFESVAPVGSDDGPWSPRVFGASSCDYNFRLAPGETMETKPADEGGLADKVLASGLTVRQHYAALAMQGMLSDQMTPSAIEDLASLSVAIADAMIEELERRVKP